MNYFLPTESLKGRFLIFTLMCTLLSLNFYSCHREDLGAYRMSDESFSFSAIHQVNFQLALLSELGPYASEYQVKDIVEKRRRQFSDYFSQLTAMIGKPVGKALKDEDRKKLEVLRVMTGGRYKLHLIGMIRDADQELIGLHIKATSPEGLKNDLLRDWADSKIEMLITNLKESQLLD